MDIDDRGIQLLLREIQSDSLILAMKGASEPLREKIFKNISIDHGVSVFMLVFYIKACALNFSVMKRQLLLPRRNQ